MTYGPPLYPPPPPPKRNIPLIVAACVLGGAFWVTVLASLVDGEEDHEKSAGKTVSITSSAPAVEETEEPTVEPAEEATLGDAFTELITELAWEDTDEEEKDTTCASIDVFGVKWFAKEMRASGDDPDVDWDMAAEIIAEKCDERGSY